MTELKQCSKCGTMKPLSDYYKDKANLDGLKGSCKVCYGLYMKQYQQSHIERCRQYGREYGRTVFARTQNNRRQKEYCHKEENKPKLRARIYVRNRVSRGLIIKPASCSVCLKETPRKILHAHHPDYTKPNEFIWVCPICHCWLGRLSGGENTSSQVEDCNTVGRCSSRQH